MYYVHVCAHMYVYTHHQDVIYLQSTMGRKKADTGPFAQENQQKQISCAKGVCHSD